MAPLRRIGCLFAGLLWAFFFMATVYGTTAGDCWADEPAKSRCEADRRSGQVVWLVIDFALLVGIGWFFYRREMKDGDF